jgi:beta-lactamase superfamily II metal-dependent hydrolase
MPTMTAPSSGVKIRMYCQGQGDCFLLALPGEDGQPRYMLIDCGLHHGVGTKAEREARMIEIAENIKTSTGGHVHLVVATHEHTDHINGFSYAADVFTDPAFTFDRLWMAWTEDPNDPEVVRIKDELHLEMRILLAAAQRLRVLGAVREADMVNALLGYSGYNSHSMEILNGLAEASYLRQGDGPLEIPGVPSVRFFVLSPPHDYDFVMKWPNHHPDDVYGLRMLPLNAQNAMLAAVAARGAEAERKELGDEAYKEPREFAAAAAIENRLEASQPFAWDYRIDEARVADSPSAEFFKKHYGVGKGSEYPDAWRRIDTDWLRAAETVALKLGSRVNNTSLVLALQFVNSGKVLFFPGDAQAESWNSWHDNEVAWEVNGEDITVEDLLENTVYYKASHHGSHNATLRTRGLEIMDGERLVSMLPVGANNDFGHPAEGVLEALKRKSKGRVIRADEDTPASPPSGVTAAGWTDFRGRLDEVRDSTGGHKLYSEYVVEE